MKLSSLPRMHEALGMKQRLFLRFSLLAFLAFLLITFFYESLRNGLLAITITTEQHVELTVKPRPPYLFSQTGVEPPTYNVSLFQPPFHTSGRRIVDSDGHHVKLCSVNWYGASDVLFVPSGLDIRHRDDIAALVRRMGFNSVRMPYSDELVRSNPLTSPGLLAANPDLVGLRALDVFAAVVESLTGAGLAVIVNDHITQAAWCCGTRKDDLCDASWSNDWLGQICRVRQTEEDWIENWEVMMRKFIGNPLVVGADLRNEVRGIWGTMTWSKWAAAAERVAERLLAINPTWLIFVEGVSSANDLLGVQRRPIKVSVPNQIVYSAHVYAWSGWGSLWPYSKRSYQSFAKDMRKNWAYLLEGDIAPVWVGEMGAPDRPERGDYNYWSHLIRFLDEVGADWGYWAINPRKPNKNEFESYGLLEDDWSTVRWDYRMSDMIGVGLGYS